MSYDISFKVKVEGVDVWLPVGDCDANITWNVREIITQSTGLEWKNEADNGLCIDIIPKIHKGYDELLRHPERYKHLESPNGWGTVAGTKRFFKWILDAWQDWLNDDWYAQFLAPHVHFWIE